MACTVSPIAYLKNYDYKKREVNMPFHDEKSEEKYKKDNII